MEEFIKIPNLPRHEVSLAVVDGRIDRNIENMFKKLNIKIIKTKRIIGLYEEVAYHPDIMVHHLGDNRIIVAPNINDKTVYELEQYGFDVIIGKREIGNIYPMDIAYNAARVGNTLICNVKYSDNVLLENANKIGLEIIHVKQGYTKCSICIVDQRSIITSDLGIAQRLINSYIDTCLIKVGDIELFDSRYGFIGGASGYLSGEKLSFFGDISLHTDFEKIHRFLIKNGKTTLNLSKNKVNDYGTLIPLKEYSILTK